MVPYLIGSEKSQRIVLTSQHEVGAFFLGVRKKKLVLLHFLLCCPKLNFLVMYEQRLQIGSLWTNPTAPATYKTRTSWVTIITFLVRKWFWI